MKMKPFSKKLSYMDVISCTENRQGKKKLTVISNVTLTPIFQKYVYYYDNEYVVDYISVNEYLMKETVLYTCFLLLNLELLSPYLYYHFYELTESQVEDDVNRIKEFLNILFSKLETESELVFIAAFEKSTEANVIGQVSYQSVIDELNYYIYTNLLNKEQFNIINIDSMVYQYGYEKMYQKTNFYLTNSPYSAYGCNVIVYELLTSIENKVEAIKKCIVLDCDNVLWGGIIGEVGIDGIQLSNQFAGRAYMDFQRQLIKLYYQGIILCLCSKNELAQVQNVIDHHPDMLLREKFIAAKRVNYKNKADNIRELAIELNISLNSMVFVDDNLYEIELVKFELPEVSTIYLNPNKPHQYTEILISSKYFYKKQVTDTDKLRGQQYKEREKRQKVETFCSNIEEYHKFLETKVTIEEADEFSLARIAELSQRTNQFNLSAKRYDLEELKRLISQGYHVLYLRAEDKYGDMGIVAASIVYVYETYAVIEAMFLSCKVFGRGFETQLLENIRNKLAFNHIQKIYGVYRETSRNKAFKKYYPEHNISLYTEGELY